MGNDALNALAFLSVLQLSSEIKKWRERPEPSHDDRIVIVVDKDLPGLPQSRVTERPDPCQGLDPGECQHHA
jgi:hypothetical protein